MKYRPTLSLLAAFTLLTGAASYVYTSSAQHYCGQSTECINSGIYNTCIKTATSLPSVDVNIAGDWYVDRPGSHCGASKCYVVLACECGPPLSSRLCTSAEKTGA